MRLLLVEDDQIIAKNLRELLVRHGYAVDWVETADEASDSVATGEYDGVILDRRLPDGDGVKALSEWRQEGIKTPVLVLTALSQKEEVVRGLDAGADDYLAKPFVATELLARVRAMVRRAVRAPHKPVIKLADLAIDTNTHRVERAGQVIELSPREYAILEYLAIHPGQVVERVTLLSHAWDETVDLFSNALDVHMTHLRKKIDGTSRRRLLRTVRGKGYMLWQG